jgi:hypothetical protein
MNWRGRGEPGRKFERCASNDDERRALTKGVALMIRFAVTISIFATLALASGFTFNIGNPVAAQVPQAKTAVFVFRTQGCAEPAKSQITASAEGIMHGDRRSVALRVAALDKPGVYAVFQNWGNEGKWVVVLKGACEGETAGAIVPVGPKGFIRESSKIFDRQATSAEIDASLKTLIEGETK